MQTKTNHPNKTTKLYVKFLTNLQISTRHQYGLGGEVKIWADFTPLSLLNSIKLGSLVSSQR